MHHEELTELSKVRLENAKVLIKTAQAMIDIGDYKSSANRSYYAVFSAMRACLALLQIDSKKHSGVISEFRQRYLKTNKLKSELSDIITELFDVRNQSDYNDFYVILRDDVQKQLSNAELFIKEVDTFLQNEWKNIL